MAPGYFDGVVSLWSAMLTESYSLELLSEVGIPSEERYLSIGWKVGVPKLEDDVCSTTSHFVSQLLRLKLGFELAILLVEVI